MPKSHVDKWNPMSCSPLRQDSAECPKWRAARFTPLGMAVPTRQRARRRRPQHGIVTMWYAAVCRVDITRDGGSASQATATSVRAILPQLHSSCTPSSCFLAFLLFLSFLVTSFMLYLELGFFGSMAVLSLRGMAVLMVRRQLNF